MDPTDVERELRTRVVPSAAPSLPTWAERTRAQLAWLGPARVLGGVALVIVALIAGWWLLRAPAPPVERTLPRAQSTGSTSTPDSERSGDGTTVVSPARLVVHVAGSVTHPGLVRLAVGTRVADAIAAAGGPLPEADLNALNLAAPIEDGTRIYVPLLGETIPDASGGASGRVRVDLNRGTEAQLDALPGVGPTLARAIVTYRGAHGPFRRVEDLLGVPGIGTSKLALFRDLVSV